IGQDMQPGPSDIQTFIPSAVEDPQPDQVHEQAPCSDPNDHPALDDYRISQTYNGFDKNEDRNDHQQNGIDQRCQNFHPVITVGALRGRRSLCNPDSAQAQGQCGYIGQHVASVCQQRQRLRPKPANHFRNHVDGSQHQGQSQAAFVFAAVSVSVSVSASVPVSVSVCVSVSVPGSVSVPVPTCTH